jgi:hypothetical protein
VFICKEYNPMFEQLVNTASDPNRTISCVWILLQY